MGRPPLPVGTFGKIDFLVLGKDRVRARASFRDYDGHRRSVTRYGSSRAHAERRLREALRDRGTGDDPVASMTRARLPIRVARSGLQRGRRRRGRSPRACRSGWPGLASSSGR
jgi:hypothetical protein